MLSTRGTRPLDVVQITDCHLLPGRDDDKRGWLTAHSLEAVLGAILAESTPDLMLATGDLADDPLPETYRLLAETFARVAVPTWCLPGNHDEPDTMAAWLDMGLGVRPAEASAGGWRFLLLDSFVAGEVGGRIGRDQLAALEEALGAVPHRPTLVAVHHPPVSVGSPWMDAMGLVDGPELVGLLERHRQVRVLVSGHAHQAWQARRGTLLLCGTPSTCFQFLPGAEDFALDDQPPGWRRLRLFPDGHVVTRVERLTGNPPGS